ncbi:WD_REPEATS_REGION domain-containing protein, partial [Haematococcus lacustris]
MQWDPTGEQLAMVPGGGTFVYIWTAASKELQKIDTDFKTPQELSTLCWSRNGLYLSVGTAKGNLLMYNSRERKKTQSLGKHTKKVVCSVWNNKQHLAMAGLDRMVTITDGSSGDTLRQFALKGDPVDMCVASRKEAGQVRTEENTYSINVSRRTIYIMECQDSEDKPLELEFLPTYGNIHKHLWFGDGFILVAFKSGQVVVVSSLNSEISEEVFSSKVLDVLSDVAYAPSLGRIAVAGACNVRILDASGTEFTEVKADAIDLEPNQAVERVGWTRDGQVLTLSTASGQLLSYLAALPVVYSHHATKVMHLTSLLELSVVDVTRRGVVSKVVVESEPAFCGLGPNHAAVSYHRLGPGKADSRPVSRRQYLGSVASVSLSGGHAVVLLEGKAIVHPIEVGAGQSSEDFDLVLPPPGKVQTVLCVALTPDFIITGSKQGELTYYLLEDGSSVNEYRHDEGGILHLYPQPDGSRLIFEDDHGNLNLFNPVSDQVLVVPQFTGKAERVMWDQLDPNVFVVVDASMLHTYLHIPISIAGPRVEFVCKQHYQPTHTPILVHSGSVACRLKNGSIDSLALDSHRTLMAADSLSRATPLRKFQQCLRLGRLKMAWDCAVTLGSSEAWGQLGVAGLELLDIHMAVAAYRMLGDASMVLSLEQISQYEDKNLLAAHVMVLLDRDHAAAQELFLRSSVPKAALEMRKDLKQWSEALKLAEQLDPDAIAGISKEHAASLELTGEYSQAKVHYQQ